MADSDEEYVGSLSDDEDDLQVTRTDEGQPRKRKQRGDREWELSRTWETLKEGADGTISATVDGLLEASKRKRSELPTRSSMLASFIDTDFLSAWQVTQRYHPSTTRYHSTSHSRPRPLTVHVRERPPANAISLDAAVCPGICPGVLRAKPHLATRRHGPPRRPRPSNQRY